MNNFKMALSRSGNILVSELSGLLQHPDFEEALYCHMESTRYGANPEKLIAKIAAGLKLAQ